MRLLTHLLPLVMALAAITQLANASPPILGPADVAIVINTRDPLSRQIGAYYARQRHIPQNNIATVSFDYERDDMPAAEFSTIKAAVDRRLSAHVQAYVLTWARPYRVGCMSITSAFAFGTDAKYCANGCQTTGRNPYYNANAIRPFDTLHLRLAIMLAATTFDGAKYLIDQGVRADSTAPTGTAYLITTNDAARNARAAEYPLASRIAEHELGFHVVLAAPPQKADDVMFYFTGATTVPQIATYRFRPGAIADHLTSFGGMLTDSPQMSSLRWLQAGATASYGTVVEPCNLLEKFPNLPVLLTHYLAGETLIEAYWKSVAAPGQGVFLGEPLAAPFRPRP